MSNEDLIEEMLWTAYQHDKGIQLAEMAGTLILKEKIGRMKAYEKAYHNLKLDTIHI
jgi:hypothetical protein